MSRQENSTGSMLHSSLSSRPSSPCTYVCVDFNLFRGRFTHTASSYNTFVMYMYTSIVTMLTIVLADTHCSDCTDVEDGIRAPGLLSPYPSARVLEEHIARRYLHIHYGHVRLTLTKVPAAYMYMYIVCTYIIHDEPQLHEQPYITQA